MEKYIFKGRVISKGFAEGLALVSPEPISFYGGVDPDKGIVIEKGHPLYGKSVKDKILVFPYGKGSTVGSYIIYRMVKNKVGPLGIINMEAEPIVAIGAIISRIPLIDKVDKSFFSLIEDGDILRIDGYEGFITLEK